MVVNYDNMLRIFNECNERYFGGKLPVPYLNTMSKLDKLARFEYNIDKGNVKHPIKWQEIKLSDCYEYSEDEFRDIMLHEMIHYYLAWNGIRDNGSHGKEFIRLMEDLNVRYGFHIVIRQDVSLLKRSGKKPKRGGLLGFLFG